MYWGEFRVYVNSLLVFLFFLTFNLLSGNKAGFWENAGRSLLITSLILVSIALLLGPLSRIFPKKFTHDLLYRKPLAYAGTIMVVLYLLEETLRVYRLDVIAMLSAPNPDSLPWVFCILGAFILLGLAFFSMPYYIRKLGFGNWKAMQPVGYAALVFMLFHIALVKSGFYMSTISGKTVLAFGAAVLFMKAAVILAGVEKRHSQHEIKALQKEHR